MSVQLAQTETPSPRRSTRDRAVAKLAATAQVSEAMVEAAVAATHANEAAITKATKKLGKAKAIATISKVLKKADADAFDKLAVKLQPNAPAAAESKVVKAKAPVEAPIRETAAHGMFASSYLRTWKGDMMGTFGALLQTPDQTGFQGKQCRHPHATAELARRCARDLAIAVQA